MIKNKQDYLNYLEADRVNLKCRKSLRNRLFHGIWRFQRVLRATEYYTNCTSGPVAKLMLLYLRFRLSQLGTSLGFSIPINVFGPGLAIVHKGTIVVNPNAKVGANCRIHVCVNIGASGGKKEAPNLGNNIYIAPGAKLFGDISLADNIAIGANAVVNKSFDEADITIGGIPAKKIAEGGSEKAGWRPVSKFIA